MPEAQQKAYIIRINGRDSREDILVDELDRHILGSIFRPGVQKSKQSLNLVVRVDVLYVRPPVRWDIVDATGNSSDDSKIVTSSLESPEEICVMKSVRSSRQMGFASRNIPLWSRRLNAPEFCDAEAVISDPFASTTRAERKLSAMRP